MKKRTFKTKAVPAIAVCLALALSSCHFGPAPRPVQNGESTAEAASSSAAEDGEGIWKKVRETLQAAKDKGLQSGSSSGSPEEAVSASSVNETGASSEAAETAGASAGEEAGAEEANEPAAALSVAQLVRPSILSVFADLTEEEQSKPDLKSYSVEGDFENVHIPAQMYLQDRAKEDLRKYLFHIDMEQAKEYFSVYESNRYDFIPNFVTTDSMMHTYHLYFSLLMKTTERNYLSEDLKELSRLMFEKSADQLESLKGTEWETAAVRNTAFFAVGASLLGQEPDVPPEAAEIADEELALIAACEGTETSPLLSYGAETPAMEDYTQYIVRGYYEGDPELEAYFRAMMWFGRMNFTQKEEDLDRSALLITLALDEETQPLWEGIYTVTAFFAGASDDNGYYEYRPVIDAAYGEKVTAADLAGAEDEWNAFHLTTASLPGPQINSVIKTEEESGAGFRFMGQRFSIDAAVFTNLIYDQVKENKAGDNRMLPSAMDIPAAMGSDTALAILKDRGETEYAGYEENMEAIRTAVENADDSLWNASLYSKWLNTLQPLVNEERDGWPSFMQSDQWQRKDLQTYLGSYAELKHDTVLYSKQSIPEMGGGDIIEEDDRGYVEPEPVLYDRLAALTQATSDGLKSYGMLDPQDEENLARLSELAASLKVIAEKELAGETPTEEEFELIRGFGGSLEHFWLEAYRDREETVTTFEFPAAIVTDIASDPAGGNVLEVGTGSVGAIYAVVPVDGKLTIAKGAVYSFYEFTWPSSDRLTDTEWREMMGIQRQPETNFEEPAMTMEDWTSDFQSSWRDQ